MAHRNNANRKNAKHAKRTGFAKRPPRSTRFGGATGHSSTAARTRIAPDELDVRLMFRKTDKLINGSGGVVAKAFHSNSAYDVDPSIGSTETMGFDEYAQLYDYYRVIGFSYEVTVINPMDYPILFSLLNTGTDPTLSGSNFALYSTNPHCKSKLVSTIGSVNNHTFRGSHKVSQIVGTSTVETADSWRSLTSTSPTDLTWITVAGDAIGASDITFVYDFKLIMNVRFYGRKVDLTLAAAKATIDKLIESRQALDEKKREEFASRRTRSRTKIVGSSTP